MNTYFKAFWSNQDYIQKACQLATQKTEESLRAKLQLTRSPLKMLRPAGTNTFMQVNSSYSSLEASKKHQTPSTSSQLFSPVQTKYKASNRHQNIRYDSNQRLGPVRESAEISQIREHQQRYDQGRKTRELSRNLKRRNFSEKAYPRHYKSQALALLERLEKQEHEQEAKRKEEKSKIYVKKKVYSFMVREVFKPSINQQKRQQVEEISKRIRNDRTELPRKEQSASPTRKPKVPYFPHPSLRAVSPSDPKEKIRPDYMKEVRDKFRMQIDKKAVPVVKIKELEDSMNDFESFKMYTHCLLYTSPSPRDS